MNTLLTENMTFVINDLDQILRRSRNQRSEKKLSFFHSPITVLSMPTICLRFKLSSVKLPNKFAERLSRAKELSRNFSVFAAVINGNVGAMLEF